MLPNRYNPKESEKKWQEYWEQNDIYKFNPYSEEIYSIDTPPPTVSGKIHIGHVFSYNQIEMIARYWRMKGYNVFFPFGFDDNGLPTERLVEKQHKIKANEMPREEFAKLCLETTADFEKQFQQLFKSLGFGVDWSLEYSTINEKAQRTSQQSFIDLFNQKKVYSLESPTLWCTECQTSIAQAELDTKLLDSTLNYLKFNVPVADDELIIATTRPELLPGCVAIFVNPEDADKAKFIGKEAVVPIFDFKVPIIADEKADMNKGSGAVMCCTFGDSTDVDWWKKYNLPLKKTVSKDGKIENDVLHYGGMKVNAARQKILEDLSDEGYLLKSEPVKHQVAVHERCSNPIEFNVSKQWYIDIMSDKDKFLEAGDQINWYPSSMKARYTDWVKNIQWDWCISRQRFFGVPFPVWYCEDCGEAVVAKEENLPVNPLAESPKEVCKCGCSNFRPEMDVMDTWATSSITPLINANWGDRENVMNKLLPMSLRPNSHDIIRTWDFYTIVKNMYHLGEIPWKNVMISGHVLAGKGEKISKSKDNATLSPEQLISNYSADTIRYWAAAGRLGNDVVFSEGELKNADKLINKLWNVSRFAVMHLQDYEKQDDVNLLPLDRWILSKQNKCVSDMSNYLEKYEVGLSLNSFEKFFWGYCDNYIEIVKDRLYKPEVHGSDARLSGQKTLYDSLLNILKVGAIYFPHVTEEIYQDFFKEKEGTKSIHATKITDLCDEIDEELIKKGDFVVDVISGVRKYKSEHKLPLKTEIDSVTVKTTKENFDFLNSVEDDVKVVCRCNNIVFDKGNENEKVIVEINPDAQQELNTDIQEKSEIPKPVQNPQPLINPYRRNSIAELQRSCQANRGKGGPEK